MGTVDSHVVVSHTMCGAPGRMSCLYDLHVLARRPLTDQPVTSQTFVLPEWQCGVQWWTKRCTVVQTVLRPPLSLPTINKQTTDHDRGPKIVFFVEYCLVYVVADHEPINPSYIGLASSFWSCETSQSTPETISAVTRENWTSESTGVNVSKTHPLFRDPTGQRIRRTPDYILLSFNSYILYFWWFDTQYF